MELTLLNNTDKRVIDDLRQQLRPHAKLQIAAASFSIYAYEALREELEQIDELQFLFTSPTFSTEKSAKEKREFYIPKLNRERDLYGTDFEIRLRNQLSQRAIAKECAAWIRSKVRFKTNITDGTMQGSMMVSNDEDTVAYLPIQNFTTTELGCEPGNNLVTQIMRMGTPYSRQFLDMFNDLWTDTDKMRDVTERVLDNIETVYKENAPEFIYFLTLYNIFHEFQEGVDLG